MRLRPKALLAAGILICSFTGFIDFVGISAAAEPAFNHAAWDRFLKKYVNEAGEVDYAAVKADPALLNEYLAQVQAAADRTDPNPLHWPLKDWRREEQLAFWLNVYHAVIVSQVVQHYPLHSLNDVSGVWTAPSLQVGARSFSLNDIRSRELLAAFRDEKIHLALACSARSCPPFPREAFTAPRVEGQLFLMTTQRVQDERFVQVVPQKKKVFLSRLFYWYGEDFILDFGTQGGSLDVKFTPPDMAVLSFVRHYTQDAEKIDFLEGLNYKIKYLPFDWTLAEWHKHD